MRRITLMTLFLLLLIFPALADTTWTVEDDYYTYIYTQVDTEWGHILYREDKYGPSNYVENFKYGSCTFDVCDDYVSVYDETTGVQTFYRGKWVKAAASADEAAAYAENVLANAEVVFIHDRNRNALHIPGMDEISVPPGGVIQDAYDRQQRLFMTIDTADGRHFLYIVTWQDGLDVRAIEIPWSGYFDSYHVGDSNDCIYLWLEMFEDEDEDGRIAAYEEDGRWTLEMVNAIGMYFFTPYGVQQDMYRFWAYGTHPWNDIETMDWNTLPLTYEDAVAGLSREGWRFPHEDQPIYAAPDVGAKLVALCPKDTPVCVIRTEGEWAYVGAQLADDEWDACVGYMLTSALEEMPLQSNVLPGGELCGWFVMMTVDAEPRDTYGKTATDYFLHFAPIDPWTNYQPIPVEVRAGFIEAARAAYLEKGYAATPIGFDEALLPYLMDYWPERETICDAIVTDSMLALAVRYDWDDGDSEWLLRIVNGTQEVTNRSDLRMPGPFRFDRERVLNREQLGISFIE